MSLGYTRSQEHNNDLVKFFAFEYTCDKMLLKTFCLRQMLATTTSHRRSGDTELQYSKSNQMQKDIYGSPRVLSMNQNYFNLIKAFSLTDFKLKYQSSILGYFWSLLNPLLTFGVFYVVFALFVRFDILYYNIYLLLGIIFWNYFSEATQNSMAALVEKGRIIKNIYFPRTIVVIAANLTTFLGLVLNLVVFLVFFLFSGISVSITVLFFVVYLLLLFFLTLGFSFVLAALNLKYRDVQHLWRIAIQILFWATPVVYPLKMVPQHLQKIFLFNPFFLIIDGARSLLIYKKPIVFSELLLAIVYTCFIFFVGYIIYRKMSEKFPEWI